MEIRIKFIFISIIHLFNPMTQYAQDICYEYNKPISPFAFRKMMRDHYNFTILGTNAPVSGFKVETSQPSITLKGNIISPRKKELVTNLELSAGVQNGLMQIFSGDQLNGYFKASIGFNYMMMKGNSAKYILNGEYLDKITRKKVCEFRENISLAIDSALVLEAFEHHYTRKEKFTFNDFIQYIITRSTQSEYTIDGYKRYLPDVSSHYTNLVLGMLSKYGIDSTLNKEDKLKSFFIQVNTNKKMNLLSEKLSDDQNRYLIFRKDSKHKYRIKDEYEINAYKDIWSSKMISWINLSISATNSNFRTYNSLTESLLDTTSLLPSVNLSYNLFKKWMKHNQYLFFKVGIGIKRVNSLLDLEKFDYKKETIITINGSEQLKNEKSGTAYRGNLFHGIGFEAPIEIYWAPWELPAIPGLYSKLLYSYGDTWINKNKLGFDIGIIWNVHSQQDNDKNLISIVPYMSWLSILKEYKDAGKTIDKDLSDQFLVGVKFGIPVNIGK